MWGASCFSNESNEGAAKVSETKMYNHLDHTHTPSITKRMQEGGGLVCVVCILFFRKMVEFFFGVHKHRATCYRLGLQLYRDCIPVNTTVQISQLMAKG